MGDAVRDVEDMKYLKLVAGSCIVSCRDVLDD